MVFMLFICLEDVEFFMDSDVFVGVLIFDYEVLLEILWFIREN